MSVWVEVSLSVKDVEGALTYEESTRRQVGQA